MGEYQEQSYQRSFNLKQQKRDKLKNKKSPYKDTLRKQNNIQLIEMKQWISKKDLKMEPPHKSAC